MCVRLILYIYCDIYIYCVCALNYIYIVSLPMHAMQYSALAYSYLGSIWAYISIVTNDSIVTTPTSKCNDMFVTSTTIKRLYY